VRAHVLHATEGVHDRGVAAGQPAGEPADVVAIADGYARWLATSEVPKLFVNADPGTILTGAQREFCRRWPNQEEVTVRGTHFIQEDSPREIGEAVARFVGRLPG
jgi:haloalkane dehalogenase